MSNIEQIKKITMKTILDGEPVWFGCDTGKMMERTIGLWDKKLFDYAGVYDTEFKLSKADRLIYGESAMTHAMVFTGVDVVDGKPPATVYGRGSRPGRQPRRRLHCHCIHDRFRPVSASRGQYVYRQHRRRMCVGCRV